MRKKYFLIVFIFLYIFPFDAIVFGQDLYDYPKQAIELDLDKLEQSTLESIEFLADKEGSLSIEDVTKMPYLTQFSSDSMAQTGIEAYWHRFRLKNITDKPIDLSISPNLLRAYVVYIFDDTGKYDTIRNGAAINVKERPQGPDYEHFYLTIPPKKETLVYIRAVSGFVNKSAPLNVHTHDDSLGKKLREILYIQSAAISSILLVMGFYNLMLFFFIKDRIYLYYTLALLSATLYFIGTDGLGEYIYGIKQGNLLGNYAVAIMAIFLIQFTRHYYKTKSVLKKWDIAFRVMNVILCVLMISYYITLNILPIMALIANIVMSFGILYSLAISIYAYKKKFPAAKYYLISMVFFFVFAIYYLLQPSFLNIVPASLLGLMSLKIGFVGQLLLFSLALAARINILRDEVSKKQLEAEKIEKENILRVQKIIKEKNIELEEKVEERTEDLKQINEELNQTVEELDSTNEMLKSLNDDISKKNDNILASITYASRIQQAMLPFPEELKKMLGDYFLFYQPKDLVAGDFYWVEEKYGKVFLAAADCTGHGVPGAFMSMIGNELLNQIIINQGVTESDKVLGLLHEGIRKALKQEETNNRDGMDIALVIWDKEQNTLQFSGAHNPLILIQNGQLQEIKGGKHSIGGLQMEKNRVFEVHNFDLNQVDKTHLYIYSDGYQDQFGGKEGRKFMKKKFKELLLETHTLPIEEQETKVKKVFADWVGDIYPQTDDILLIGMCITKQKT